jgi:hypothetical protein
MFVKKIQCICLKLVVDAVAEADGTDESVSIGTPKAQSAVMSPWVA